MRGQPGSQGRGGQQHGDTCRHPREAPAARGLRIRSTTGQRFRDGHHGLDGRDEKLLQWVTDSGLACLISDNYAVELIPTSPFKPMKHAAMPLHEHCIFKNGIHLGEMWYLTELARWLRAHQRNRFLLTAPPLRLPGAVGSPAVAVATV